MKGILFLILTLCLFYVGGMYRSSMLLTLAIAQGLIWLLGVIQVLYCKRTLTLRLGQGDRNVTSNQPVGKMQIENRGRFPISCFQMELIFGNKKAGYSVKKKLFGCAECGKSEKRLEMYAPYCGLWNLRLKRVVLYDYFFICQGKQKEDEAAEIAVFPEETEMDLKLLFEKAKKQTEEPASQIFPALEYQVPEVIRQIREYREGDPLRFMHWKLSARMDSLYVKEFEDEKKGCITLFLDMTDFSERPAGEQDAFYKVLSAFLLAFLQINFTIQVYWHKPDKQETSMEVVTKASCRALLYQLYKESFGEKKDQQQKNMNFFWTVLLAFIIKTDCSIDFL